MSSICQVLRTNPALLLAPLLAASSIAAAQLGEQTSSEWDKFIDQGEVDLSFRYRYEGVDDDRFDDEAKASTVRSRLTLTSGRVADWQLLVEVDDVRELIFDDFDAGAGNTPGRTRYPGVSDPEGTEINQAYVSYTGVANLDVRVGRQRINLDNQRFVGGVGWRQNEQTYDALSLNYARDALTATYVYVDNVNRIFGEDVSAGDHRQSGTHLVNASWNFGAVGKLTGYYYDIDNDDAPLFSTTTWGLRWQGKQLFDAQKFALRYALEYAGQSDAHDNPANYDEDYLAAELGVVVGKLDVGVGLERLGAESGGRFITPLATLHKFNGWADVFLAGGSGNPVTGLEDSFVTAAYTFFDDYNAQVRWHDFESDMGGDDLGNEFNFSVGRKLGKRVDAGLFFANFDGDGGYADERKYWLMVTLAL